LSFIWKSTLVPQSGFKHEKSLKPPIELDLEVSKILASGFKTTAVDMNNF
jgi:hypothetical protein